MEDESKSKVVISISFTVDKASDGAANFYERTRVFLDGLKEDFGESIREFQGQVDVTDIPEPRPLVRLRLDERSE